MVSLSGVGGEQTREGRLELAAPPAIGRDARYAGSEILGVPRIAHEDDSKRRGGLLEGVEERAVGAIEMRVVEEQNRRVGTAGGLRRAHDLGFGGLDAHDLHRWLDTVGRVQLHDEARLVLNHVLDGDAIGQRGEAGEYRDHRAVEGATELRGEGGHAGDGARGQRLRQRLAVALRPRRTAVESPGALAVELFEPRRARLELAPRQGARAIGFEQGGVRLALAGCRVADDQEIVSGAGGAHRRLADRAELADGAHLEIVRDDHPAEAELAPEIVRDDGAREGRGHARSAIEARVERVRRHDAVYP